MKCQKAINLNLSGQQMQHGDFDITEESNEYYKIKKR